MIFPNDFAMLENEFMPSGATSRLAYYRFDKIVSQLTLPSQKKGPRRAQTAMRGQGV
jgi:hypothetical protein